MGQGGNPVASAPTTTIHTGSSTVNIRLNPVFEQFGSDTGLPDALRIISKESGVLNAELIDNTFFTDMGIDFLLSLLCASSFHEETGLTHKSTIFAEHTNVRVLRKFWTGAATVPATNAPTGHYAVLHSLFHDDHVEPALSSGNHSGIKSEKMKEETLAPLKSATSLILQGIPATPATIKTLFNLPDGSDSLPFDAALPRIQAFIATVGLNCPYMKNPHLYTCGIEEVANIYIHRI
jgi:noranthrone synthase